MKIDVINNRQKLPLDVQLSGEGRKVEKKD